jgi:sulfopyruvate decarboxylase subunit beta
MGIPADQAFKAFVRHRRDEIIVSGLGTATQEWHREVGPEHDDSFHVHSMGTGAGFALGLALAQPERTVWVFDGDGALIINFGALLTMAGVQPPNLRYFLVSNRRYGIIAGDFLPNSGVTDFAGMASAAGIVHTRRLSTLKELEAAMPEIASAQTFQFVEMEIDSSGLPLVSVPYEGPGIKYRFAQQLRDAHGIEVLGGLGY